MLETCAGFFVARPTTFAIIENLKYLVLDKDSSQPFLHWPHGKVWRAGLRGVWQRDRAELWSNEAADRDVQGWGQMSRARKCLVEDAWRKAACTLSEIQRGVCKKTERMQKAKGFFNKKSGQLLDFWQHGPKPGRRRGGLLFWHGHHVRWHVSEPGTGFDVRRLQTPVIWTTIFMIPWHFCLLKTLIMTDWLHSFCIGTVTVTHKIEMFWS